MKFVKAHCGANDFIILDSRKNKVPKTGRAARPGRAILGIPS